MNKSTLFLVSLLCFLYGCNSNTSNPYQKKNGTWYFNDKSISDKYPDKFIPLNSAFAKSFQYAYYRDEVIPGSEGQSFEALSEHYAKDNSHVYYCDTYRSGQDYFTTKRTRIVLVSQADPTTFKYLYDEYGRDEANMFYEGKYFPVKDINTFQMLEYGFARDSISGYYQQTNISASDGKTFNVLDNHYSKDKNNVYYSTVGQREPNQTSNSITYTLPGALPSSFNILSDGYAKDAKHVFYENRVVTDAVQTFEVMPFGYARSGKHVYYYGKMVPEADASTFTTFEMPTDSADAKDKHFTFQQGKKVK